MVKYHKIPTTLLLQKSTSRLLFIFTDKKINTLKREDYFFYKSLIIRNKKKVRYTSNGLFFVYFRVIFNQIKKKQVGLRVPKYIS